MKSYENKAKTGGVDYIKNKKMQLIFKGLRFCYGNAYIFSNQPQKQPLKLHLLKTALKKPYPRGGFLRGQKPPPLKTAPQKPPLYKNFDRFTGPPKPTQFLKVFNHQEVLFGPIHFILLILTKPCYLVFLL